MRSIVALSALCALAGAAQAQLTYLATSGDTLYRVAQGGTAESFSLSDTVSNLTRMPNGDILAVSGSDTGSGTFELYRLVGAETGSPSLELIRDDLTNSYPAATYVGDTLYGYRNGSRNLVTYDIGTGVETEIGPSAPMQAPVGGAAYDADNDVFYAITRADAGLYTIDYTNTGSPDATMVGALGFEIFNMGLDLYEGMMYAAFQNTSDGQFLAGTLDVSNAQFTPDTTIFDGALDGSVGFIVIPAPPSVALLALGACVAGRRRR